jgi:hypothetical protein
VLIAARLDGRQKLIVAESSREFSGKSPANHPALADFTDGVFYIDTIHPTTREKGFEE